MFNFRFRSKDPECRANIKFEKVNDRITVPLDLLNLLPVTSSLTAWAGLLHVWQELDVKGYHAGSAAGWTSPLLIIVGKVAGGVVPFLSQWLGCKELSQVIHNAGVGGDG